MKLFQFLMSAFASSPATAAKPRAVKALPKTRKGGNARNRRAAAKRRNVLRNRQAHRG